MARSKRDIDKETMFNKIMPSSLAGKTAEESTSFVADDEPSPGAPALEQPKVVPNKATLLYNESGVQFKDKNPSLVVNIMEKIVLDKLDAAFTKFNCCKCDRCKKDVVAIALNKLKPKYVVVEQENIFNYVAKQTSVEVTTAIVQAIITVRANPRH